MNESETPSGNAGNDDSSTDEIPVQEKVIQTQEGVKVECKSVRGSGTRDSDTVTARQYYDDAEAAYEGTDMLTVVVRSHMRELRNIDENGR